MVREYFRVLGVLLIAIVAIAGSVEAAYALSAGCNDLTSQPLDSPNVGGSSNASVGPESFDAGDIITLTYTRNGVYTVASVTLTAQSPGDTVTDADAGTASTTLTVEIPSAGSYTVGWTTGATVVDGPGQPSIAVTCAAGQPPAKATTTSIQSSLNPSQLGDAVTFTATVLPASGSVVPAGNLIFTVDGVNIATVALSSSGVASLATSMLTAGTHSVWAIYGGSSSFSGSASPVLGQIVGSGSDDSQNLREMQIMATKLVAQTSGQSMQGAIDTAIDDGFDENGNPITPGDNSLQFNFAAEPKAIAAKPQTLPLDPLAFDQRAAVGSSTESASDAIDGSLGRASQSYGMASGDGDEALGKRWRPWINIRDTQWDAGGDEADVEGNQVNALAGVTYKISPKLLVGVFAGYEDFSYSSVPLDATLDGNGWTAGAYLGWRVAPALRFDAGVARSSIDYSDTAGSASGEFDGERWFFTSGLTGTHKTGAFIIEPSAKIYALWENEDAYTDSLGTAQAERDFSTGRASGGFKLAYPVALDDGGKFVPFAGVYGDYYFSDDDAGVALTFDDVIDDGWSARLTGGFSFTMPSGVSASLSGEVGGLGSGAQNVSGRASVSVPF